MCFIKSKSSWTFVYLFRLINKLVYKCMPNLCLTSKDIIVRSDSSVNSGTGLSHQLISTTGKRVAMYKSGPISGFDQKSLPPFHLMTNIYFIRERGEENLLLNT